MKATLSADGTLTITPESELEAYALTQWYGGVSGAAKRKLGKRLSVETTYEQRASMPGRVIAWPSSTGNDPHFLYPTVTGVTLGNATDSTSASAGTCP